MGSLVRKENGHWSPFQETEWHRHMNRVMDEFLRDWGLEPARALEAPWTGQYGPKIDVSETEKDVTVKADLPGMEEKDLQVEFSDGTLTIAGEKKAEHEEKGRNYHRMERAFGAFRREIHFPMDVDAERIEASYKHGVLTVTLPKTPDAQKQAKKIQIKSQ